MAHGKNIGLKNVTAMMLAMSMVLSASPLSVFADTVEQGLWKINNTGSSGTAVYGDLGFTYYSPTTELTYGASGGKDYVRSTNT